MRVTTSMVAFGAHEAFKKTGGTVSTGDKTVICQVQGVNSPAASKAVNRNVVVVDDVLNDERVQSCEVGHRLIPSMRRVVLTTPTLSAYCGRVQERL